MNNHPECVNDELKGGVRSCPYAYSKLPGGHKSFANCKNKLCEECWNEEIEEDGDEW